MIGPSGTIGGAAIQELAQVFGDRLTTNAEIRRAHGKGEESGEPAPPDAVAFPVSTDEVIRAVTICGVHTLPIIPFGSGSSLEGQVRATRGGLCLDMSRMKAVLAVNDEDLDCRVETGVTREQLNAHLRDTGLFFPIDPGYDATLGGMASTRASGTNAVRYGTMRDAVLGLTVITPDGRAIRTGSRARKSSAGYDLTRLFVGAEGTLGIITELQLRLFARPERIAAGVTQFADVNTAIATVTGVLQIGVPVARMEFLDELQMRACIDWSGLTDFDAKPTLFFEFHGSPASVEDQIRQVNELIEAFEGAPLQWAEKQEDRNKLWRARHDAYHAGRGLAPGKANLTTDACVPISRLAECIARTRAEAARLDLIAPIVGHVGDGNFHVNILFDRNDAIEAGKARKLYEFVGRLAIAVEGTSTGEHGVGVANLGIVSEEVGDAAIVMAQVKRAIDPQCLFNPDKTVPTID